MMNEKEYTAEVINTIKSLLTPNEDAKKDTNGRYEDWSPNAIMRIIVGLDGVAVTFYTGFTGNGTIEKIEKDDGTYIWKYSNHIVMVFKPYILKRIVIKKILQSNIALVVSAMEESKFSYPNLIEIVYLTDEEIDIVPVLENEAQALEKLRWNGKLGYLTHLSFHLDTKITLDMYVQKLTNPFQCIQDMYPFLYREINQDWHQKKYVKKTTRYLIDKRTNRLGSVFFALNNGLWNG